MPLKNYQWGILLIIVELTLMVSTRNFIDSSYNLPKNVIPVRYILTMEPIFETNTTSWFNGSVIIEIKALETTSNVTLHVRNLKITENTIKVTRTDGSQLRFYNTTNDRIREFYTIHLEDDLIENEYYNLSIGEFRGALEGSNKVGFYLAKYESEDGKERLLAVTDFEASDARQAFPCFDEPATKAKFIIKLIRSENYNSVSNEELLSTEKLENEKYMDTFRETVDMSTYLAAFMVSDYQHTQRKDRHRVFAKKSAVEEGKLDYALSAGIEILQALEKYTGINYTLSKIDQVAIPDNYFMDEAMENWGMVTFSEKHLFISKENSTTADIQRCTCFIAHEFAHQWFGNLVTFKEWKYIWLSEGFGSFFQYYIPSLLKPSWRLMDQFVLDIIHKVIEHDTSIINTQPLNYQPQTIGAIPSPWICYFKASAILRMVQHFLTEPIFHSGLQIYLNKHMFSATEPLDLYEALQEAVNESKSGELLLGNNSIASILKTWDSNVGHPLIIAKRDYESGSVTLSQERHLSEGTDDGDSIWYVPISYVVQSDQNFNFSDTTANFWLTNKTMTVNKNFSSDSWLILNKQQIGFYRVNYDLRNWEQIAAFLDSENYNSVHVLNRAQLLDDAFHFAQVGRLPFNILLNLTKYLIREKDYVPLKVFDRIVLYLDKALTSSTLYRAFQDYVTSIYSTAYNQIGFSERDTDQHLDVFNRKLVLKWLCTYGHFGCRNNAIEKLRDWKTTGKFDVSPDLQLTVLCGAIRTATIVEWEFLYNKFSDYNEDEGNDVLMALGCSENKSIIQNCREEFFTHYILDRCFQEEPNPEENQKFNYLAKINSTTTLSIYQVRVALLYILSSGPVGLNTAFEYLQENKSNLNRKILMSFRYDIGEHLTTEDQMEQLKSLGRQEFKPSIREAQENLNWANRGYLTQIEDWFLEYNSNSIEVSNII